MAGYFLQLVDPERDGSYTGNSVRAFSELPYHLVRTVDRGIDKMIDLLIFLLFYFSFTKWFFWKLICNNFSRLFKWFCSLHSWIKFLRMKILLYTLFKTTNSLKGILLYNVHLFAFHLPCFLSYRPMVGILRLCHKWCVVWSLSATNVDWVWEMFCWRITKKRVSQKHSKYNLSTVHGLNLMFLQKNLKELMYTCTCLSLFCLKNLVPNHWSVTSKRWWGTLISRNTKCLCLVTSIS